MTGNPRGRSSWWAATPGTGPRGSSRWCAPSWRRTTSSSSPPPPHLEPTRASSVLGYPRIGPRRQLKRALERYWHGDGTRTELLATGRRLREATWHDLVAKGLTQIPGNTFSFYDHILDDALLVGAIPARFRDLTRDLTPVDTVFALARGRADVPPLELVPLQGTSYLYRQPEFDEASELGLRPGELLAEVARARELGLEIRPVITGPVSLLLLGKASPDAAPGFAPLDLLDSDRSTLTARISAASARNEAAKEWAALQIAAGAGAGEIVLVSR